jgi:hypothetical protein
LLLLVVSEGVADWLADRLADWLSETMSLGVLVLPLK